MISLIIDGNSLTDSPLNSLRLLLKQTQENFEILLDYMSWMPRHKSTMYLERFYFILGTLVRFVRAIEEFEIKEKN